MTRRSCNGGVSRTERISPLRLPFDAMVPDHVVGDRWENGASASHRTISESAR